MYTCVPSSLLLQPLSTQALAMFVTTPQTQIVFGRDSIQLLWSHRNAAIDMAVNASNRQSQQRLVQQVQWMVRLDWNYIILWQHSWELRRGVLAKGNNQSWRYLWALHKLQSSPYSIFEAVLRRVGKPPQLIFLIINLGSLIIWNNVVNQWSQDEHHLSKYSSGDLSFQLLSHKVISELLQ